MHVTFRLASRKVGEGFFQCLLLLSLERLFCFSVVSTMSSVRQVPLTCPGHSRAVPHFSYGLLGESGQSVILSACHDGRPMLRYGTSGDWIGTFEGGHKGAVWCTDINTNATFAATGGADWTTRVWNMASGDLVSTLEQKTIIRAVAFAKNGHQLATAGRDGSITLHDVSESTSIATVQSTATTATPESEDHGVTSTEKPIQDKEESPSQPAKSWKGHGTMPKGLCWMPGDAALLSVGDSEFKIWDPRSGTVSETVNLYDPAASMEMSRSGTSIVISHGPNVSYVDPRKGWGLASSHKLKGSPIVCASQSPIEDRLVVAHADDTVLRVYGCNVGQANAVEVLEEHRAHHGPIHWAAFAPDGASYASSGGDATLRIWQTHPQTP